MRSSEIRHTSTYTFTANAVPTAEGAIELAIAETPITIHNSKCIVMGYGKVGKALSHSLSALGAHTFVQARKYADLALIENHGCHPLTMNETKTHSCVGTVYTGQSRAGYCGDYNKGHNNQYTY